mmetsp:Transcript_10488/g.36892  ORF Transcript_10488/g.36892 Transcript_10488/m.36892 type:complete len:103 (-) Transcript_10488:120-428(-)
MAAAAAQPMESGARPENEEGWDAEFDKLMQVLNEDDDEVDTDQHNGSSFVIDLPCLLPQFPPGPCARVCSGDECPRLIRAPTIHDDRHAKPLRSALKRVFGR